MYVHTLLILWWCFPLSTSGMNVWWVAWWHTTLLKVSRMLLWQPFRGVITAQLCKTILMHLVAHLYNMPMLPPYVQYILTAPSMCIRTYVHIAWLYEGFLPRLLHSLPSMGGLARAGCDAGTVRTYVRTYCRCIMQRGMAWAVKCAAITTPTTLTTSLVSSPYTPQVHYILLCNNSCDMCRG